MLPEIQNVRIFVKFISIPDEELFFHKQPSCSRTASYFVKIMLCSIIIRVTLFSRYYQMQYHETLFSRFIIFCSIIFTQEIIGEDFIFAYMCSRDLTRK